MKLTSGKIFVDNMRFRACHGVLPQEKVTGGDFLVSVSASYPLAEAVESDDVATTLNYAQVYGIVKREMSQPSALIEHVAGRIGASLLRELPGIEDLRVKVVKVNPPMGADCDGAGVELRWKNG